MHELPKESKIIFKKNKIMVMFAAVLIVVLFSHFITKNATNSNEIDTTLENYLSNQPI
jgi:hypothetical protein